MEQTENEIVLEIKRLERMKKVLDKKINGLHKKIAEKRLKMYRIDLFAKYKKASGKQVLKVIDMALGCVVAVNQENTHFSFDPKEFRNQYTKID